MYSNIEEPLRIDAEIYQEKYLNIESTLKSLDKKITTLGNISKIFKKGIFDIKASVYTDEGVPFVRISNLKDMGIDTKEIAHIPPSEDKNNQKTHLTKGDLILSKTAYPAASIVNIEECNCSQDTIAIKLNSKSPFKSSFLTVFLNTKYGIKQMERWFTGNVQMHLNLSDSKDILVPQLSKSFQKEINDIFWWSFDLIDQMKQSYKEAENILLKEIGLKNFKPSKKNINIKTLSDSLESNERLDAEYYLPKYEEAIEKITTQQHNKLSDIIDITKSVEPGSANYSDTGIPFLRVADYTKFNISEPDIKLSKQYYYQNKKQIDNLKLKKNTILFSKDGSVGNAYNVKQNRDIVTSSAILHLRIKNKDEILPEYLALVLNSKLTDLQAERDAGGSIIVHWRMSDIRDLLIPIIDINKQKIINELLVNSFNYKDKAKKLREIAIQSIELAIEQNENEAKSFIKNSLKKTKENQY